MIEVWAWVRENPATAAYLASALVNMALRFRSPEEWVSFGERSPYLAFLIRAIRAVGLDPIKLVNAFAEALRNKAGKVE